MPSINETVKKFGKNGIEGVNLTQNMDDFMGHDKRLLTALELLGVKHSSEKYHRHNLVSSIALYAGVSGDAALEKQCSEMLETIKAE